MAYIHRHSPSKRSSAGSPELVYLLVVLAAGIATAWWAGHKIGFDLSGISTAASVLGLTETAQAQVPQRVVGYSPGPAAASADAGQATQSSAAAAAYCDPGQVPAFALGLADLKQQLGDTMGTPVECEHVASAGGDTVQKTTTGLAAYNRATNTVSFTDGWRHWALTPGGLVTWEGTDPNPPTG
jgi:hypothetical protein